MSFDVDASFSEALQCDCDDERSQRAICKLHLLATVEVLEKAIDWSVGSDPRQREVAASVLGQLGNSSRDANKLYREERFRALRRMTLNEQHRHALAAAICGLGHLRDERALPLVTPIATHEDAEVRFAVAFALGCYTNDDTAIRGLIVLMKDADEDVRDWATFGLGTLGSADSPEVRAALTARLTDSNENVMAEAMVGLAQRKDLIVVPIVKARLADTEFHHPLAVEASSFLLDMETNRVSNAELLEMLNRNFSG